MSVFVLEVFGKRRAVFDAADAREAEQFAFGALLAREPVQTRDALVRNAWAEEHVQWEKSRPEQTDARWICYFHDGWTEKWSTPR